MKKFLNHPEKAAEEMMEGDPKSPINVLGARYRNPNFYVSSVKRKSLGSIRRVAITTRRRTASLFVTAATPTCPHHNSDNFIHAGPWLRTITAMRCEMALPFLMVDSVWKADC
jgi:hypothetical protein